MFRENLAAFLLLYVRPVNAIGRILDRGKLLFAVAAAIILSVLSHVPLFVTAIADGQVLVAVQASRAEGEQVGEDGAPRSPLVIRVVAVAGMTWIGLSGAISPLAALALAFIPMVIFLRAVSGFGSFGVLLRSNYSALLLCGLMTWSAARLLLIAIEFIVGMRAGLPFLIALYIAGSGYFIVLAALSIRTLFGIGFATAAGLAIAGSLAAILGIVLSDFAGPLKYYLMSPFLLYYGYRMFGSDVRSLGEGLRGRQHLRQQLETATTNPRDADAHYQLGLIYQQRRQFTEAIARFQKAIEIDPTEADAQFQLGRIAREQGRFEDAIGYLKTAAGLNEKLASGDVWRELGAAYFAAGRFEEAAGALEKYTQRRSYDPEGLYWYGKALKGLGREAEAREAFGACVEAVDTMPKHRRAEVRKWRGLAQRELG